jgi:hypothetical protein
LNRLIAMARPITAQNDLKSTRRTAVFDMSGL